MIWRMKISFYIEKSKYYAKIYIEPLTGPSSLAGLSAYEEIYYHSLCSFSTLNVELYRQNN
jgi:hypothetical protein